MRKLLAVLIILVLCVGSAHAYADLRQQGGSIVYRDAEARSHDLEFRAQVWPVQADYYRATVAYREIGSSKWMDLDRNWCWTRKCALEEMVSQARYIARDGFIWRFQNPRPMIGRTVVIRFDEVCYREGVRLCSSRLLDAA